MAGSPKFGNNASTVLVDFVAAADTSINVVSAGHLPTLGALDWMYLTIISLSNGWDTFGDPYVKEIIKVNGPYTTGTATIGNITRGVDGTTALAFVPGDWVQLRLPRAALNDITIGPQGPQGAQGAQGRQGYQGYQGNQGFQGNQGRQGYQGTQGRQGTQGTPGAGFGANVRDFGAMGDGTTNDTASFQAAINSGASKVYVPPAVAGYSVGKLTMPSTAKFVFEGSGTASMLHMRSGAGSMFTWPVNSTPVTVFQTISNVAVDGTAGTGHCFDTTYAQTLEFRDIYIQEVPNGYSGFYINGTSGSSTYSYDTRVINTRIYQSAVSGAVSGVTVGSWGANVTIDNLLMYGASKVSYCIQTLSGAGAVAVIGGNQRNAAVNAVNIASSSGGIFSFTGATMGGAGQDVFVADSVVGLNITGGRIEGTPASYSSITLASCTNTKISNVMFAGGGAAMASIVKETGSSNLTVIHDPVVSASSLAQYTTPFVFVGEDSFVQGLPGYSMHGYYVAYSFCGDVPIAAGETKYFGPNGLQPGWDENSFVVPRDSYITRCSVATSLAPGAGEIYTVDLITFGPSVVASGTISGAAMFIVDLSFSYHAIPKDYPLYVRVVASGGAASGTIRGVIVLEA